MKNVIVYSDFKPINEISFVNRDILKIVKYPNPILNKICRTITKNSKELHELIQKMHDTLESSTGVGLSAPQVGVDIRLFITSYGYANKKTWINPVITERSKDGDVMMEGCLSIPERGFNVYRNKSISIKYLDEKFKEREEKYNGYYARLIQHEYDHLRGITLMDKK